MKRYYRLIGRLYDKKVDASGLAIFRIAYSFVLLCEVCQLYYFRHLVFDRVPFLQPSEIDFSPALTVWMVTIISVMLGFYTRQAAVINYMFSLVFFAAITTYEYHMFYVYMGVNFLLMFLPVSTVNSIDKLRLKLKNLEFHPEIAAVRKVSVLNYYVPLLIGVAFVYFDSVFYKLASHNWMAGIGMWLPSSLPQITHIDASWFLNIQWLAIGLGYITFVFEAIFIFTFFRKKWRVPLLIVGVCLHIGIVLQFPIPWFGLGVIAIYLLLVPVHFWSLIVARMRLRRYSASFYYDEECPVCVRVKTILKHFDVLTAIEYKGVQTYASQDPRLNKLPQQQLLDNIHVILPGGKLYVGADAYKYVFLRIPAFFLLSLLMRIPGVMLISKWIYALIAKSRNVKRCTPENCGYSPFIQPAPRNEMNLFFNFGRRDLKLLLISGFLLVLLLFQFNVTYNSKLFKDARRFLGIENSFINRSLQVVSIPVSTFSKTYFGITTHAVFMDTHFEGYNHIIGIEAEMPSGDRIWLPIVDKDGHPDWYNYSFIWVKWTFRVDGPNVDQKRLVNGIRDFATFWAIKNGLQIDTIKFGIYVKRLEVPRTWSYDFLAKQKEKKWSRIGEAGWAGGEFNISIPEIEAIPL